MENKIIKRKCNMCLLTYLEKRIPEYLHKTHNEHLEWWVDGIYGECIHIHIKHPSTPSYIYKHVFGGANDEGLTYGEIFTKFTYMFEGWDKCYWDWFWHYRYYGQQIEAGKEAK